MSKQNFIVFNSILGIIIITLAVSIFGNSLPSKYTTTIEKKFSATPEEIWTSLSANHFQLYLQEQNYQSTFIDPKPIQSITAVAINGNNIIQWVIEIEPHGDQSYLIITEQGEVKNPFLRLFYNYIAGHNSTIQPYMDKIESTLN